MNIGNAKIGIFLGFYIFREFFDELYYTNKLPQKISTDDPDFGKNVTIILDKPVFQLNSNSMGLYPRLTLTGRIELREMGVTEGPTDLVLPLDVKVRMAFILKDMGNRAPSLGIQYVGTDGTPAFPLTKERVDKFFADPKIKSLLDSVKLDLLQPMINALSFIYYDEGNPDASKWPVALKLCGSEGTMEESVALLVGLPKDNLDNISLDNHLKPGMGLGIVYSEDFLNFVLDKGAQQAKEKGISGAKLKGLSLKMQDEFIYVNGKAEKDDAVVTFKGPIYTFLARGTTNMVTNTQYVDVDVDLPWYADMLPILSTVLFFIPGLNLANIWLHPLVNMLGDAVDAVPGLVRDGLGLALGKGMAALSEGMKVKTSVYDITVDGTPDHSYTKNGHLALYSQIFVSPKTFELIGATYSKYFGRFVSYTLSNGLKYKESELARLFDNKKIFIPEHHSVKGKYMRSNPDGTLGDNIRTQFGPK